MRIRRVGRSIRMRGLTEGKGYGLGGRVLLKTGGERDMDKSGNLITRTREKQMA